MKKLIIGVFCLTVLSGFSQTRGGYDIGSGKGQVISFGNKANIKENINGTPYFSDMFLPAKISTYTDENLLLRYNAAEDEMEFEKQKEVYFVPKLNDLSVKFLNSGKEYKYITYLDKGEQQQGYLVSLFENNLSLYKKEQIKFVPAKEASNSYDTGRPAEYKKSDDSYFIKIAGQEITNFPKNRKELLRAFPSNSDKINDYLKKNKVSFSNESDLISLVNFINSL